MDLQSPSTSHGRSQSLDYSYEEDATSLGTKNTHAATPCPKLRWPEDIEDSRAGENNDQLPDLECHAKNETDEVDENISLNLCDKSQSEDHGQNTGGSETEADELPVLPRVPVKRKIIQETRGSERRTQRGRTKSGSPPTKKQRTPQIDASVITQLQFARRPDNSVSI